MTVINIAVNSLQVLLMYTLYLNGIILFLAEEAFIQQAKSMFGVKLYNKFSSEKCDA